MMTKSWTAEAIDHRISQKLLRKMTLPIVAIGIVLLIAGIYGASKVHQLSQSGSNLLSENFASIRAAEELETVIRGFRYHLKRYLGTAHPRHLEEIAEGIPEADGWVAETARLGTTRREQQLVERISRGYQRFVDEFQRVERLETERQLQQQWIINLTDDVIPNKILVYTHKYIQLNEEQIARGNVRNQTVANQLMFGLLLLGTCGGVAGLLAGYGIAQRVSRTIVQLTLPIRDTAGKLNEVVGPVAVTADPGFDDLEAVLQTVSQRVSTVVDRLEEHQRDALRAEQLAAVGQLAAGLAHELRNPLTAIKTIVQLADSPDQLDRDDLRVLKEEIERLEQSLQTFLDFARPPHPEKEIVDLHELLEQTSQLVERRAQRQNIEFEYRPAERPIDVVADGNQLRQVFLNLLLNSFDAVSRDGHVWITVDTVFEQQSIPGRAISEMDALQTSNGWSRIRIQDDGPGLPPELEDRIFEPFVSTKETGTGLGLSICRRIVEAHGGRIFANNPPSGTGATFTVLLPLRSAEHRFEDRELPAPAGQESSHTTMTFYKHE